MVKYILGNWKMNGRQAQAQALAGEIAALKAPEGVRVALFPPAPLLPVVGWRIKDSAVALGAQDCSPQTDGAFTGDVSAGLLKDIGCAYVILGHSERRAGHGETSERVRAKAQAALAAGLIPVICVGESLEERDSGAYLDVIRAQAQDSVPEGTKASVLIAYEPVWAIGSGKIPTPKQISEVHKTIASLLCYGTSGAPPAILYGGSVKADNAREILHTHGVDGVLVGGASLKADEFSGIIAAAA